MDASKRLYRVNENKAIMGVCTGLSEYFGIDLSLMRVIVVISALFSGIPIIIYLIMGLTLPVKEIEIMKAETIEKDEYTYNEDDYKY